MGSMAIRQGVQKRCRHCGGLIDASTVRAATRKVDDISAVIFRRTIPVLRCPECDTAPQGRSPKVFAPIR
jgi:hypothetical protein